jgi:hypothetical protein
MEGLFTMANGLKTFEAQVRIQRGRFGQRLFEDVTVQAYTSAEARHKLMAMYGVQDQDVRGVSEQRK